VKLDAHRVVKDYAWYWGDFFYLIDQELTFDGVFEMAPHPMYSIGYAGYYGISMIAASYYVLFISIVAHAAQFAFLILVENPHIEKTYNPPPPRIRSDSTMELESVDSNSESAAIPPGPRELPAPVHNLIGLDNLDLFRTTDYSLILIASYLTMLTAVTPSTPLYQALFVAHALLWRLWHNVGLGIILTRQSENKTFTRHFLKYGESAEEAWRQWKGLYHISLTLCHGSFIAACWKMYSFPEDWAYGWVLLKHVMGLALLALQAWTTTSIYESLGEFGWFYGDFFFEKPGKLTYKSIYRYLNNPERVIGTAGLWGFALITWSRTIFVLALVGHLLTLAFISYVEQPHMQKIYGRKNMRREAGLTKFIKRTLPLPPPVKEFTDNIDKVAKHAIDELVESTRTGLVTGSSLVRDFVEPLSKFSARMTITRIAPDLAGLSPEHYSISAIGTSLVAGHERATGKEGLTARISKDVKTMVYEYGAPIRVKWTAPAKHSKKDWIGLYMVIDNRTRNATEVSSLGRWVPTCRGGYDTANDSGILLSDHPVAKKADDDSLPDLVEGEMVFEGDKLWWTQGVFEFRYHHDGNHNVMAISEPFEVRIGRFEDEDVAIMPGDNTESVYEEAVAATLLPVVRDCLDRDPNIAPSTMDEPFGSHVQRDSKYARRVVYAIRNMFGVDFTPAVVSADGNVRKLAWRICNAKQVLVSDDSTHTPPFPTPSHRFL
jgi:phosphatidylethanolamine N-methyltransferase